MSIADAMASNGMKEAGYEYINMDGERRGTGKATVILTVPVYHDSIDCWVRLSDILVVSYVFVPNLSPPSRVSCYIINNSHGNESRGGSEERLLVEEAHEGDECRRH